MTHIPGHHGRGMEAAGPLVKPGEGYQERDATRSTLPPEVANDRVERAQVMQRNLMATRTAKVEADEAGLHLTPAMKEALAKMIRDNPGTEVV